MELFPEALKLITAFVSFPLLFDVLPLYTCCLIFILIKLITGRKIPFELCLRLLQKHGFPVVLYSGFNTGNTSVTIRFLDQRLLLKPDPRKLLVFKARFSSTGQETTLEIAENIDGLVLRRWVIADQIPDPLMINLFTFKNSISPCLNSIHNLIRKLPDS